MSDIISVTPNGLALVPQTTSGTGNYTAYGAGAVTRTVTSKLSDTVSVRDYGAKGDGATDDTAAFQAAVDSGASAVFVPGLTFLLSSVRLPSKFGFVLYGTGSASVLKAKAGAANALLHWDASAESYDEQTIRDLGFIGTNGSQHLIDTTGQPGLTVNGLYVTDVPVGKSAIYDNSTGAADHDSRYDDIRIYSNTLGHSGIRLGPLSADLCIDNYIFNGNFKTSYGLYTDAGSTSCQVSNSHIYNAAANVLGLNGSSWYRFTNVTFDNATNDTVSITGASQQLSFTSCYFEGVKSGYSAINIGGTAAAGIGITECLFNGASGAVSCVTAGASIHDVRVLSGSISGSFTAPFNLPGVNCWARGVAGYTPFGLQWSLTGVQAAAQAQGTTRYIGGGDSAAEANAIYLIPYAGTCNKIYIAVTNTPAAGQTFTFQARKNGANIGSPLVINNGSFSGVITLGTSFAQYDQFSVQSTFSATSGSATARWAADFQA